jgi:hypothetical protein
VDKFISACVLSMETILSLVELCMSGLKSLKWPYECDEPERSGRRRPTRAATAQFSSLAAMFTAS